MAQSEIQYFLVVDLLAQHIFIFYSMMLSQLEQKQIKNQPYNFSIPTMNNNQWNNIQKMQIKRKQNLLNKTKLHLFDFAYHQQHNSHKIQNKNIIYLTMQLQEIESFLLNKHAQFINSQLILLVSHANAFLFAFSSRDNHVVMHNQKTGRTCTIYKGQNLIMSIIFTDDHLLVVEKGKLEILAFSLKTQKLKKKITGHRSQVTRLAFSHHRNLITSISHDVCIVWKQATLSKQKTMRCSTSSFVDCAFSLNGHYLFTAFKDSTVFMWNLDNYQNKQYSFDMPSINISPNYSSFVAVYSPNRIQIGQITSEVVQFNNIDIFWEDSIQKVDFLGENLIVQAGEKIYLAQIKKQHRVVVKNVMLINDKFSIFSICCYGSIVLALNKEMNKVMFMKAYQQKSGKLQQIGNPLTNEGFFCAGGFGNSLGCQNEQQNMLSYPFQANEYQLQQITAGTYKNNGVEFSLQKLRSFVRKHHILPDKHRAIAYRFLLNLPINMIQFKKLEAKGRHQCVQMLQAKYPLKNRELAESMKDVLSLLAHYSPIFAEYEHLPAIVFPFVCLFGQDKFLCFQVLYRFFTNWLNFLFKNFPIANIEYMQNIQELMEKIDIQLLNYLQNKNISLTKLCWGLIQTWFTSVLPRQCFLSMIDTFFVHPNEAQLTMFMVIGYLIYHKSQIMAFKSNQDLQEFLNNQHTVNTGKYMKIYLSLKEKYGKMVRYHFKKVDFQKPEYIKYGNFPFQAVKMYGGRRNLQVEEYRKTMDEIRYKQNIQKQMAKLATQAKRQAQRQTIQAQAYIHHSQNQSKNVINIPNHDRQARIKNLHQLINQLQTTMKNSQDKRIKVKAYIPKMEANFQDRSDADLDAIQNNLMDMLAKFKPNILQRPLVSQPIPLKRNKMNGHQGFKASLNAQINNKMWQLQKQGVKNQDEDWSNQILKAMKN